MHQWGKFRFKHAIKCKAKLLVPVKHYLIKQANMQFNFRRKSQNPHDVNVTTVHNNTW